MKKIIYCLLLPFLLLFSCDTNNNYYQTINYSKTPAYLIENLNKSMTEIEKLEDKDALHKKDFDYLEYEYPIGEKNDTYVIAYHLDDKGCFEVDFDTHFEQESDAQTVMDGFKNKLNQLKNFTLFSTDNQLITWKSKTKDKSIELDYNNLKKGMISITIFANE